LRVLTAGHIPALEVRNEYPSRTILLRFHPFNSVLCSAPAAFASDDHDAREVRLTSIQGDVRLSRGAGKHADLNKPWEQAQGGEFLERGFAVATGNGRAEIEFENGSTAYLAENSLLLFRELSALRDRVITRMTLPTGTATFALQPVAGESFFIETPTDKIEISAPDTLFARMDAYLDATAITPQGEKGESVVRNNLPNFVIQKGHTMFFRGGEIIDGPGPDQAASSTWENVWRSLGVSDLQAAALALRTSGLAPLVPGGLILQSLPSIRASNPQIPLSQTSERLPRDFRAPARLLFNRQGIGTIGFLLGSRKGEP
jgi:FecR protein